MSAKLTEGASSYVGTSIPEADQERALLSQANRLLGDDLEIVDEEDTY